MSDPFIAEIRLVSFNFPPRNWAFCNGQVLPINQNQALFSLLGTTYGGDGRVSFALPNLQGRTPVHVGNGHTLGEAGGQEAHTLTQSELPQHTHALSALASDATQRTGQSNLPAWAHDESYASAGSFNVASPSANTGTGGNQAHTNMQPFLTVGFCIALAGIFPSRN